jgi:hypothetical protein
MKANIDSLTLQDKRLALDALGIKVVASKERIDVTGSLPLMTTIAQTSAAGEKVATIERTSGYLFNGSFSHGR